MGAPKPAFERAILLAAAALLILVVACYDRVTGPDLEPTASRAILDGTRPGGNPYFHFLPPMVAQPPKSPHDPSFLDRLVVQVCELGAEAACGRTVALFDASGEGKARLRTSQGDGGHYHVEWDLGATILDETMVHRIRVLLDGKALGHADAVIVADQRARQTVDRALFIPLVRTETLPVRFRVGHEAAAWVSVARVEVLPADTTLDHLGATVAYRAVARNAWDVEIPAEAPAWARLDDGVAVIDAVSGVAVAEGNGEAGITATVEGVMGAARLVVEQVVVAVEVAPADTTLTSLGDTIRYRAVALDAGGSSIEHAVFAWSVADDAVATVDADSGVAVAVANGETAILAASGDIEGAARLVVSQAVAGLRFARQPSRVPENEPVDPPVVVEAVDGRDRVAGNFDGAILLAVAEGPDTLVGESAAAAAAGVATFDDVRIATAGFYRLEASHGEVTALSDEFEVFPQDADLAATKSVDRPTPLEHDRVIFTIVVANRGPAATAGVEVEDLLPDGLTFFSAEPSAGEYDPVTGLWSVGALGVDDTATLALAAHVVEGTVGTRITNTARIAASSQPDPQPGNDVAVAAIDVKAPPVIEEPPPPAPAPSTGSFFGSIRLVGAWFESPVVTTNAPITITGVSDCDGDLCVSYEMPAGAGVGDYEVTVTTPYGSATAPLRIVGVDGRVGKAVDNLTPGEAETVRFTVTVANDGDADATGVRVLDLLPDGLTFASYTVTAGAYDAGSGVWDVGGVASGGEATLVIAATVDRGTYGQQITNVARLLHTDQLDVDADNDSLAVTITVVGADVGLTAEVDDAAPSEAQRVRFTIRLGNAGPARASGVVVRVPLPEGLTFAAAAGPGSYDVATGAWTVGDTLDAAGSRTLALDADVAAGTLGQTLTLTAAVMALDQTDTHADNDTASVAVVVSPVDLAVEKAVDDANPGVGTPVRFTVTVRNHGPAAASGVVLADTLPAGLVFVAASPADAYDPATGSWTVGALGRGEARTLTLDAVTADGTLGETLVNRARVAAVDQPDADPANDTAEAAVTVGTAEVSLTKKVDNAFPQPGSRVTFTVELRSGGPAQARDVAVRDPLPDGLAFVSASASAGAYDAGTGLWLVPGPLAAGAVATLTIQADVTADERETAIENVAWVETVSPAGNDPADDTARVTLTLEGADLGVTKTVSDTVPAEGVRVTFQVVVRNHGPANADGVQVEDRLPDGLEFVSASTNQGSYDAETGLWTVGSLAASAQRTLTLHADVAPGTLGDTIRNIARIAAADRGDPNPDNDEATARLVVSPADLEVTKTVDRVEIGEGGTARFTVVVRNHGPARATGVVVRDIVPAGLRLLNTPSGYDPATGHWTVGSLSRGEARTLVLDVEAEAGSAGQVITNTAHVLESDVADLAPANDAASASITIHPGADLAVSKTVDEPTPAEGGRIEYTVTVTNLGPGAATGVVIADPLPSALSFVSAAATAGSYTASDGRWQVGALAVGGTATLMLAADVKLGTEGQTVTNTASLLALDQVDPNPANNQASVPFTVAGIDLAVTKTVDDNSPDEGQTVTFTVRVENLSSTTASGVEVRDVLPGGLTFSAARPSVGGYDPATGIWTVGALAPWWGATLEIEAVVNPGTLGDLITNTAQRWRSDQKDTNPANDVGRANLYVGGADLEVRVTAIDTVPGETGVVRYTVRVTNRGPAPATNIEVTMDPLPDQLTLLSHNQGTSYDPATGVWKVVTGGSTLGSGPGSSGRELRIDARVNPGTLGDTVYFGARVTATDPLDPNPANDEAVARVVVSPSDLRVAVSIGSGFNDGDNWTAPGEQTPVRYTITVTNLGPANASGIELTTDALPDALQFVSRSSSDYDPATGVWRVGSLTRSVFGSIPSTTLVIDTHVKPGTLGDTLRFGARITALDQTDTIPGNNEDFAAIAVVSPVDLEVTVSPSTTVPGEQSRMSYSIMVRNRGPARRATGIRVAVDTLPDALVLVSHAGNHTFSRYDPATGEWELSVFPSPFTSTPGETLTITADVKPGTLGDTLRFGARVIAVDQTDTVPENDVGSALAVVSPADLRVSVSPSTTAPGETSRMRYTVDVENNGPAEATGVVVTTDLLPEALTFVSHNRFFNQPGDEYDPATGEWRIPWTIRRGFFNRITLTIDADVKPGTLGDTLRFGARVTALDQTDTIPGNDEALALVAVVSPADLRVQTFVNTTTPGETGRVRYTVRATNHGPAAATGVEVTTDPLPAALDFVGSNLGGAYNPATGRWAIGALTGTRDLTIDADVRPGTLGEPLEFGARVTALDQTDTIPGNDEGFAPVAVVSPADLDVTAAVNTTVPGETGRVVYTIQVRNRGPATATGLELTTDPLPAALDFVGSNQGGAYNPATGRWTVGSLGNGSVREIRIDADVRPGTLGETLEFGARVTALDQTDTIPGNDEAFAPTAVVSPADLRVTKSVSSTAPREGDRITYTVVVRNLGPALATGVVVTDLLPAGLTFVSSNQGGGYDPVTGRWTIGIGLSADSQRDLRVTADVDHGTAGQQISNTAVVSALDQSDTNPDNDSASVTITVSPSDP